MVGAGTDRSKTALSGGPAIVLVRPQLAVNIGMCARAMANFGLSDLRLVSPREGWPRTGAYRKGAYAAAAGAVHLLESAKLYESVRDAIEDLSFVYAATARGRGQMKPVLTPAQAMPSTAARMTAGEKHGVLFGPERTGLDNDDVALADAILTFPVNPAYASLNLAQAVLLTGYEWFRAAHGDAIPFEIEERSPPATREMTLAFLRFSRRRTRQARLLPSADEEARHVAQPAQHVPPHGPHPAGRAHAVGHGRAAGGRPAPRAEEGEPEEAGGRRGLLSCVHL